MQSAGILGWVWISKANHSQLPNLQNQQFSPTELRISQCRTVTSPRRWRRAQKTLCVHTEKALSCSVIQSARRYWYYCLQFLLAKAELVFWGWNKLSNTWIKKIRVTMERCLCSTVVCPDRRTVKDAEHVDFYSMSNSISVFNSFFPRFFSCILSMMFNSLLRQQFNPSSIRQLACFSWTLIHRSNASRVQS